MKKTRVQVGKRVVVLTLDQAARVNARVAEFVRLEAEIKQLVTERWIPKYLRRTGLPINWAWCYEFTVAETAALLFHLTDSAELILQAVTGNTDYQALLDVVDKVESNPFPIQAKRRRVIVVIALLLALFYTAPRQLATTRCQSMN